MITASATWTITSATFPATLHFTDTSTSSYSINQWEWKLYLNTGSLIETVTTSEYTSSVLTDSVNGYYVTLQVWNTNSEASALWNSGRIAPDIFPLLAHDVYPNDDASAFTYPRQIFDVSSFPSLNISGATVSPLTVYVKGVDHGEVAWDVDWHDGSPHSTGINTVHTYNYEPDLGTMYPRIFTYISITATYSDGTTASRVKYIDVYAATFVSAPYFGTKRTSGVPGTFSLRGDFTPYPQWFRDLIEPYTEYTYNGRVIGSTGGIVESVHIWKKTDGTIIHPNSYFPSVTFSTPGWHSIEYETSSTLVKKDNIFSDDLDIYITNTDHRVFPNVFFCYVCDFSVSTEEAEIGLPVQFTDNGTERAATAWLWDFGDGVTSTLQDPIHTYTYAGYFTVKLTTTLDGDNYVKTMLNFIKVNFVSTATATGYIFVQATILTADFIVLPSTSTFPFSLLTFQDTSTGDPETWAWDFGDGTTSTLQNPSKVYSKSGQYTVSLTVTNPLGSDIETKPLYVQVNLLGKETKYSYIHVRGTLKTLDESVPEDRLDVRIAVANGTGQFVTKENGVRARISKADGLMNTGFKRPLGPTLIYD